MIEHIELFVDEVLNEWLKDKGIGGEFHIIKRWIPGQIPILVTYVVELHYIYNGKSRRVSELKLGGNANKKEEGYTALFKELIVLFLCSGDSIAKTLRQRDETE